MLKCTDQGKWEKHFPFSFLHLAKIVFHRSYFYSNRTFTAMNKDIFLISDRLIQRTNYLTSLNGSRFKRRISCRRIFFLKDIDIFLKSVRERENPQSLIRNRDSVVWRCTRRSYREFRSKLSHVMILEPWMH